MEKRPYCIILLYSLVVPIFSGIIKVLYRDVCDTKKADTPESFKVGDVRTRHLHKHWSILITILHRCFDGKQGGGDQISLERWMMMFILNQHHERLENPFNWGKYADDVNIKFNS